MPIPTLEHFKQVTHNDAFLERARGPNIEKVDAALDEWWRNQHATRARKVEILMTVVGTCSKWLKRKQKSTPKAVIVRRRRAVTELAQAALDEMGRLGGDKARIAFDRRKIRTIGDVEDKRVVGPGVPLAGVYKYERMTYKKGQDAISATLFHKMLHTGREIGEEWQIYAEKFGKKSFESMTRGDFQLFEKVAGKRGDRYKVRYLRKGARLRYWAVPDDQGLLRYQHSETLVDNAKGPPYTWTMDMYGNLFTAPGEQEVQFNHSSYNAGKDVVCGGTLQATGGRLKFLDNSSGHYKPDVDALKRAVWLLACDGLDLTGTRIQFFAMVDGRPTGVDHKWLDGKFVPIQKKS